MALGRPEWMDVVRHRVRRFRVPYLLVVQHHAIRARTCLVAPVSLPLPGDTDVLSPRFMIDRILFRARLLDIGAVPIALLDETVASAASDRDSILDAIDIILHGYPVGRPR